MIRLMIRLMIVNVNKIFSPGSLGLQLLVSVVVATGEGAGVVFARGRDAAGRTCVVEVLSRVSIGLGKFSCRRSMAASTSLPCESLAMLLTGHV
jgi:hypothetical protein